MLGKCLIHVVKVSVRECFAILAQVRLGSRCNEANEAQEAPCSQENNQKGEGCPHVAAEKGKATSCTSANPETTSSSICESQFSQPQRTVIPQFWMVTWKKSFVFQTRCVWIMDIVVLSYDVICCIGIENVQSLNVISIVYIMFCIVVLKFDVMSFRCPWMFWYAGLGSLS